MPDYPVLGESTQYGEDWVHSCGTTLLAAEVSHSIHDSLIPLAGSGRVHTEIVPFCPKCQEKPSPYGAPIKSDPVDTSEAAILRRMGARR